MVASAEIEIWLSDVEVATAIDGFAADLRRHYGDRLAGLYLFGSRARGDHCPDSDVDIAVVLTDEGWRLWDEKRVLADLAYDHLIGTGIYFQAWPFSQSRWFGADDDDDFLWAARRDAKPIGAAGSSRMSEVLWSKAIAALRSAERMLAAGDANGAANRAYYAMFDAARALLRKRHGIRAGATRTHKGLIAQVSLHLIKPGLIDSSHGRALGRAFELKIVADYDEVSISGDDASEVVAAAAAFLDALKSLFNDQTLFSQNETQ